MKRKRGAPSETSCCSIDVWGIALNMALQVGIDVVMIVFNKSDVKLLHPQTGWTLPSVSFNTHYPLPDSELHEYILHLQEHIGNIATVVQTLRCPERR